jgi:hypothetical protein
LKISLSEEIQAPVKIVWGVIMNTADYPVWNTFVIACHSTFEVGSPIVMRVNLLPFITINQKETIFQNQTGNLLEYGINVPFGILSSSRQHILTPLDSNATRYESIFVLKGFLAPIVGFLLGSYLKKGFGDMTTGLVRHALQVNSRKEA